MGKAPEPNPISNMPRAFTSVIITRTMIGHHDQIVETASQLRSGHVTADSARAANVKAMSNGHDVLAVQEPTKRGRKSKARTEDIDSSRHTDGTVPANDAVTEELLADVV